MNVKRIREIVGRFKGKKILVIGDFMLDEYIQGKVERISPEAPVPVVDARDVTYRPGGAGNVTANISALGGVPYAMGVTGRDEGGERLREMLKSLGVNMDFLLEDPSRPTTRKTRIIAGAQQLLRVDWENRDYVSENFSRRFAESLIASWKDFDAVVISDYGKGVVTERLFKEVTGILKDNLPVILDPKDRNFRFYRDVTTMTPNVRETEVAVGIRPETDELAEKAGRLLIEEFRLDYAVITRGEKGLSVVRENSARHIPARARKVFDVTGAGDTVASVFALALACGATPEEAGEIANIAGGLVVEKPGTATVTVKEIENALKMLEMMEDAV